MTDDSAIMAALRIDAMQLAEDNTARKGALFAAIAADMHDFVPCIEEAFRDELDRRYGLSRHSSDDDLDAHLDIFDAIVSDDQSRYNAPFSWVWPDESTLVMIEHAS